MCKKREHDIEVNVITHQPLLGQSILQQLANYFLLKNPFYCIYIGLLSGQDRSGHVTAIVVVVVDVIVIVKIVVEEVEEGKRLNFNPQH